MPGRGNLKPPAGRPRRAGSRGNAGSLAGLATGRPPIEGPHVSEQRTVCTTATPSTHIVQKLKKFDDGRWARLCVVFTRRVRVATCTGRAESAWCRISNFGRSTRAPSPFVGESGRCRRSRT